MEKVVYTSDLSDAKIDGARFLVEVRRIDADGNFDTDFGVYALDAAESDEIVSVARAAGRRMDVRGRRKKRVEDV